MHLHDREALLRRERQRRFLEGDGWVAWPGPAMADFLRQFVAHNRMLEGGFVIEDRLVTLADIRRPILAVVGTVDQIAPAAGVRAIEQAAPAAEIYELPLRAGHFGLVVGSLSTQVTWPAVAAWTRWRAGEGPLPEGIAPLSEAATEPETLGEQAVGRVGYGLELAAGVGVGMARSVVGTATRAVSGRARGGARGGRAAAAARPARADAVEHADLARAARRGAAPAGPGRGAVPVRGSGVHRQGRRRADRQRRPRPDLDRRPSGRARRRADEHEAERARLDRRAQPARRGVGAAAPRRRRRTARRGSGRSSGSSPTPSTHRWPPGSRTSRRSCSEAAEARATSGCR